MRLEIPPPPPRLKLLTQDAKVTSDAAEWLAES